MSKEKKLWVIDENWMESYMKCDGKYGQKINSRIFMSGVEATEEEIKELLEADWNPEDIEDEYGDIYRHYEATEIKPDTIDSLKAFLRECGEAV